MTDMRYIARCKKTLYYDWTSGVFGNSRKAMSKRLAYNDLFNNAIVLISKKDQIAIIEDTGANDMKLKLDMLAGKKSEIDSDIAHRYFELIYLDDTCFETRQKLINKLGE